MEVLIKAEPKEIAALVVAIQERQAEAVTDPVLSESMRDILLEFAETHEAHR